MAVAAYMVASWNSHRVQRHFHLCENSSHFALSNTLSPYDQLLPYASSVNLNQSQRCLPFVLKSLKLSHTRRSLGKSHC